MYEKTITVFNRYKSRFGDTWHPTVITNVNLIVDRASIFAKYGENATDNAMDPLIEGMLTYLFIMI